MRTSQSVYNQLLWDRALSAYLPQATLHHLDRLSNQLHTTPLLDWRPIALGGDIPWHRVHAISVVPLGVIWHRTRRIDLLRHPLPSEISTPPTLPYHHAALLARHGCGAPISPVQFRDSVWTPILPDSTASPPPAVLRVAFWNICVDTYHTAHVDHRHRHRALLDHLGTLAVSLDVIALTEVQPHLASLLLAEPWVRNSFQASFEPTAPSFPPLHPYGPFLLVRTGYVPSWSSYILPFSPAKRALIAVLDAPDAPLILPVLHLTSSTRPGGREKRHEQLKALSAPLAALPPATRIALLADLNIRDPDEAAAARQLLHLQDAWSVLRPRDPGITFDPLHNPLAALASSSRLSARFDRVLFRDNGLRPTAISLFAEHAVASIPHQPPVWLSDHAGVCATFAADALALPVSPASSVPQELPVPRGKSSSQGCVSFRKAVAIIPPVEVWPALQAIRRRSDSSYFRWPPHINLLFGFVDYSDETELDDIVAQIRDVVENMMPFDVVLDSIDSFEHAASTTFYAKPDADAHRHLTALQAALQAVFPCCTEQSRRGSFNPHLKLGNERVANSMDDRTPPVHMLELPPVQFRADRLCIMERYDTKDYFTVKRCIPIGPQPPPCMKSLLKSLDAAIRQSIFDTASAPRSGSTASLHLVGSRGMGLATAESDIDVVVETSASHIQLADAVTKNMLSCGLAQSMHVASRWQRETVVRANVLFGHHTSVDVLVSSSGSAARQAVSATNFLRDLLHDMDTDEREAFQSFYVGCVKPWTKLRGLIGTSSGNLPSVAWLVFALYYWKRRTQGANHWELCRGFFQMAKHHDFSNTAIDCLKLERVQLAKSSRATIWKPCAPLENLARSLTSRGLETLRREVSLACERASVGALLEERAFWKEGRYAVVLSVGFDRDSDMSAVQGWLTGRLQSAIDNFQCLSNVDLIPWPDFSISSGEGLETFSARCAKVQQKELMALTFCRKHICLVCSIAKGQEKTAVRMSAFQSAISKMNFQFAEDIEHMSPKLQSGSFGILLSPDPEAVWKWYQSHRSKEK